MTENTWMLVCIVQVLEFWRIRSVTNGMKRNAEVEVHEEDSRYCMKRKLFSSLEKEWRHKKFWVEVGDYFTTQKSEETKAARSHLTGMSHSLKFKKLVGRCVVLKQGTKWCVLFNWLHLVLCCLSENIKYPFCQILICQLLIHR